MTHTGGRPGPPGLRASSVAGDSPAVVSPWADRPASERKADGLPSRCSDQGKSSRNGTTATISALTGSLATSQRRTATAATANATPRTQASGANAAASATSSPVAHAARRAWRGAAVSIRPALTAASGATMKATAVPRRPAATAPVATGSSAYDAASSTRAGVAVTSQRLARYAVRPASGTQPSSSTSTASHAWPPSTVPSAATTARYGGADAVEPTPTAWKPARYSCHRADAPPQAGTRAPPPSGLVPSSLRSAASETISRTANSCTPGWPMIRRTTDCVSTNCSSSSDSSELAWCLPSDACGGPFDTSPAIFSASRNRVRAGAMNWRTAAYPSARPLARRRRPWKSLTGCPNSPATANACAAARSSCLVSRK